MPLPCNSEEHAAQLFISARAPSGQAYAMCVCGNVCFCSCVCERVLVLSPPPPLRRDRLDGKAGTTTTTTTTTVRHSFVCLIAGQSGSSFLLLTIRNLFVSLSMIGSRFRAALTGRLFPTADHCRPLQNFHCKLINQ